MSVRPSVGDPARRFAPLFRALNRGMRSIACAMKPANGTQLSEFIAASGHAVVARKNGKLMTVPIARQFAIVYFCLQPAIGADNARVFAGGSD
ncbi:hypothetical protein ACP2AV_10550 [Aliiroseovarius sp. PTFE2010]